MGERKCPEPLAVCLFLLLRFAGFFSLAARLLGKKSDLPRGHGQRQSNRRGRFFARIES